MEHLVALFTRWKPNDCKAALLASAKRSQMGRNKVMVQQKKIETEIAACLQEGREEKARIKAENLVHLQKLETAYDMLETLTELIQTRMQYISESKECPPDLATPIASVIYASKRLQIPEFKTALRQFAAKYGASFTRSHEDNNSNQVAPNLVNVLLISPPKEGEIHDLLVFIAQKHSVDWVPPRKPETTADRNRNAQPLFETVAPVVVLVDTPAPAANPPMNAASSKPVGFVYSDNVPPPPTSSPASQQQPDIPPTGPANDITDLPPAPPSPVNDPQYNDLMERLRRLKLTDDSKPSS